MIVARIEGGLGNQLFQYAFGTQIAHQHGTDLVLDLSPYASKPAHGYLLNCLAIKARELRADERKRIPGRYRTGKRSIFQSLSFGGNELRRVRERPFGFSESYMTAADNSYLVGYWQSEKFFPDVVPSIREQFVPAASVSDETKRTRDRMLNSSSIAIHVRRGDYITTTPMAVRNLSLDYYRECVLTELQKRDKGQAYVFSNDIDWCRQHLDLPCPTHFVAHNTNATAFEDLWLMSAAQSFVIANSTFSWWGAYLGDREKKTVYAPKSWYHPNTMNDQFLNCRNWILVNDPVLQSRAA